MRQFVLSAFLCLALTAMPAHAEMQSVPEPANAGAMQSRLDDLFAKLKQESNEAAARGIAERIREEWRSMGGPTADLLIDWARKAAEKKKFNVALDLLDQVVVLYPQYVEGWDNRALVYLMMRDYSRAMSDLSQVLTIEPRHFGALSGLAGILRATDHPEEALKVYRRMLEIYPMQRSAQRALLSITDEQTDERL